MNRCSTGTANAKVGWGATYHAHPVALACAYETVKYMLKESGAFGPSFMVSSPKKLRFLFFHIYLVWLAPLDFLVNYHFVQFEMNREIWYDEIGCEYIYNI